MISAVTEKCIVFLIGIVWIDNDMITLYTKVKQHLQIQALIVR